MDAFLILGLAVFLFLIISIVLSSVSSNEGSAVFYYLSWVFLLISGIFFLFLYYLVGEEVLENQKIYFTFFLSASLLCSLIYAGYLSVSNSKEVDAFVGLCVGYVLFLSICLFMLYSSVSRYHRQMYPKSVEDPNVTVRCEGEVRVNDSAESAESYN